MMKDYILSILKENNIKEFYFDKFYLLNCKEVLVSIAFFTVGGDIFNASVKKGICYELVLMKNNNSIISFDFFDYIECMEMYELIVGKNAALVIDSYIDTHYWKDVCNHNVKDDDVIIGSPVKTVLEYEPR